MPYPYEVLKIAETADQKEVRRSYLQKIREFPPEKSPVKFQEVTQSYQLIKNEMERVRLQLFGMPGSKSNRKLCDLFPEPPDQRSKIGIEAWLAFLR